MDAKATIVTMFPEDGDGSISLNTRSQDDASPSAIVRSPSQLPGAKASKSKGSTKAIQPNAQLHSVKAPTDDRNVWLYQPTLKSMDMAAASRDAASARAAALSLKLADVSSGEEDTTLITVRLPDNQSATFKAMRSTSLDRLHAATAAAFNIESEFFFSLAYPKKLLLQQSLSLDAVGLIPQGLLLVVFSDEADTVRKSIEMDMSSSKVCLGNILEMELKEQQNITKNVQSHIITRHPKVANLLTDAKSAKNAPVAPSNASAAVGDDVSAAVDGLFLKTNVELQTISNSSSMDMPIEAMKKMVRIEAAQEQRHLDREHERQQYQQHMKRLDAINAGADLRAGRVCACDDAYVAMSPRSSCSSYFLLQAPRKTLSDVPPARCSTRSVARQLARGVRWMHPRMQRLLVPARKLARESTRGRAAALACAQ